MTDYQVECQITLAAPAAVQVRVVQEFCSTLIKTPCLYLLFAILVYTESGSLPSLPLTIAEYLSIVSSLLLPKRINFFFESLQARG